MANDGIILKAGVYSVRFIEALAMSFHLNLITSHEFVELQAKTGQKDMCIYLEGLIRANAPKFRADREATAKP